VASATPGSAIGTDSGDNLYIAGGGSVRKLTPDGGISTIANEDGVAIAVDQAGNVYLAQGGRVRKIMPTGQIATVAGNGTCGYTGDGGAATGALVCANGVAVDGDGYLYVAEAQSRRIRRISPDGVITTVAGTGDCCYSGDGGPAVAAQLNLAPWGGGMSIDRDGNVYIGDAGNQRVRAISANGVINTVAGGGSSSIAAGNATGVQLNYPTSAAVDSQGNLYISDTGGGRVLKVSPDGSINPIVEAFGRVLAIDKDDNLYFVDGGGVHKIAPSGTLTTLTTARLNQAFAGAVDNAGNFYVAEIGGQQYRVQGCCGRNRHNHRG
jgi:trimeric autotransporter adhesin